MAAMSGVMVMRLRMAMAAGTAQRAVSLDAALPALSLSAQRRHAPAASAFSMLAGRQLSSSASSSSSSAPPWSSAASPASSSRRGLSAEARGAKKKAAEGESEVAERRAEDDRIAHDDPLFRKPVGAVEGTGWSVVIAAGFAVAAVGVYSIGKEFVATPKEQIVYDLAFEKVEDNVQLSIYFGKPISSAESSSRSGRGGRRLIAHSVYDGDDGRQHVQVHGRLSGPRCEGAMHADMVRAAGGGGGEGGSGWELDWMYVDVGPPYRKRVVLQHQQVKPERGVGA